MNLRPLGDRVVIKPVEREERTKSGIVLPDTAQEKPQERMVEAVGNGRFIEASGKREPLDVKVGHRALLDEDAVAACDSLIPVGEQREGEISKTFRVGLVGPDMVDADGEHLGLPLGELLVITSQGGELVRSTRTEVVDVEAEQDML